MEDIMRRKKNSSFKTIILWITIFSVIGFTGWKVATSDLLSEFGGMSALNELTQEDSTLRESENLIAINPESESNSTVESEMTKVAEHNHTPLINSLEFHTGLARFKETGFFPMFLYHNRPAEQPDLKGINQINVPLLNQQDFRWAYSKYGDDSGNIIAANGCAVVSLAMIDSFFKNEQVDPNEVAEWAGLDHYVTDVGTAFTIYADFAKVNDYNIQEFYEFEEAMTEVQAGNPVVVAINPGYFSPVGHVMVIRGYEDGKVYINDPNDNMSSEASSVGHDEALMIEDAIAYWSFSEK